MVAGLGNAATAGFRAALQELPSGYSCGAFETRTYGVTVWRSDDERRIWLFAEELGGTDVISFNAYVLTNGDFVLKPCEMSVSKVSEFVLGFRAAASSA